MEYLLERRVGVRALVRSPERLLGIDPDRLEIAVTAATRDLGFVPLPLAEGLPRVVRGEPFPSDGAPPLVRVAVVGLGKMGLFHSAVLSTLPGVRVVATSDANPALGRAALSMGLRARFHPTLAHLLAAEPVDAVFVCTPTFTHPELAQACLERRIPVFVEKPLADRLSRAQELAGLAAQAGVVTAVGYFMAYSPIFERARDLLQAGFLGRANGYRATVAHGEVFTPKQGWLFDPARSGGGVVMNPTAHLLFLLHRWFGRPRRITATTRRLYSPEVEDEASATLEYADGLCGGLEASWSVPGKPILEIGIAVSGENGTLQATRDELTAELAEPRAGWPVGRSVLHVSDLPLDGIHDLAPDSGGAAYYLEDREFVEAVRASGPTRVDFATALEAERVIEAIYRSAGFRAYSRRVLETIPHHVNSNDFVFDSQFLVQAVYFGFRIGDVPVPVRYMEEVSSINFRRSVCYGLGTLATLCAYLAHKARIRRSPLFEAKRGTRTTTARIGL